MYRFLDVAPMVTDLETIEVGQTDLPRQVPDVLWKLAMKRI